MLKNLAAALLVASLGGLTACASTPEVEVPEIQEFSFMLGNWTSGPGDLEVRMEFYMKSEHRMEGATQIFSDQRLAYYEQARLEFNPRDIRLHIVKRDGKPRMLTLVEHGPEFAVFENLKGSGVQRMEYRKAADAALDVSITGIKEGRAFQRRWEMQRPTSRGNGSPLSIGVQ